MKVLKPTTIPFPSSGQFIRGSTATYIEDGLVKTAAVNEPRWQDGNLMLEGEATNLVQQSYALGTTPWSTSNASIAPNAAVAPDGTNTADKLIANTSATTHFVRQDVTYQPLTDYVHSGFAKAAEVSVFRPALFAGGAVFTFDASTGVFTFVPAGASAGAVAIGNGWWRYWCRATSGAAPTGRVEIYTETNSAGDGSSGILLWGIQIEAATSPTSYIPTTAAATRSADICIGNFSRASTATYIDESGVLQTASINEPRVVNGQLLVEKSSTNISTWSEAFQTGWSLFNATTTTTATGPSGVNTAKQLNETAVNASHGVYQVTTADGSNKTFTASVFAKARSRTNFHFELGQNLGGKCTVNTDLSTGVQTKINSGFDGETYGIQALANGWYRIWITAKLVSFESPYIQLVLTPDGTTTTYLGVAGTGIDIFGAQLEESDSLTSYIPTTTIAVTRAADIHGAGLVWTNAVDADAIYSSLTTYSTGQRVTYSGYVYESLQDSNLNKTPDTNPTWWLSLGASNTYALFDSKIGTKTTATDNLKMIIYPGSSIDSIAFLDTDASVVNTSIVNNNKEVVYSNTTGLSGDTIENWYDYFFVNPLSEQTNQVVHHGIPSLETDLIIGVEMSKLGTLEVGSLLTGLSTTFGKTQYGLKSGIVDYSKKQADEFGNITIVERPFSKRMSADVYVSNYDLNKVQRFLYNIRATPVLWMASDDPNLAEVSYVYGFYKDFSTTIAYPDVSMCNLEIEGLI